MGDISLIKITGDKVGDHLPNDAEIEIWEGIVEEYTGKNPFILDVMFKVHKYKTASVKQVMSVVKCFNSDKEYALKNKERLDRLAPMKDGKGEVIGEVVSLKTYDSHWSDYTYKMLIEDFKGYRVFGTVPSFFLDEDVKVGDFVKFKAKLRQKELGFGFFSYAKECTFVEGKTATISKETLRPPKPSVEKIQAQEKAKTTRELMDFLSA